MTQPKAKPTILTVDDDPAVLRSVERDLRRQYGQEYRVVRAESGQAALSVLDELKKRGEPVALIVSDHRMPRMDGAEFLRASLATFPDAKRVLLTAYADTDAAIRAINGARIDHYLLKPWDPPEENLYPVLTGLLEAWQDSYRPDFVGVKVVGHRWSPRTYELRDFLARNLVPYRWLNPETDSEARAFASEAGEAALPLAILQGGERIEGATIATLAQGIGLTTQAKHDFYDLVIVGSGPAGLAAAVYGASEGLRTAMIEREAPGGQAGMSSRIENYLGFPTGISGSDLARYAVTQAKRFGAEVISPQEATGIRTNGSARVLSLKDGQEVACRALLVCTGVSYTKLAAPGVEKLAGAGVYYGAAMTEALNCRDEEVYIVGGANSAGQAAMYFSRYARHVTMLVRGEGLAASMSSYLIEQISETPNIAVRTHAEVSEVHGEEHLTSITVHDRATGEDEVVPATSLFVFIGAAPRTAWLGDTVARDERGFILTGSELPRGKDGRPRGWPVNRDPFLLETSTPGIFAAGDVRRGSVKRVASGVGEGAIAVQFVHQYLADL